MTKRLKRLLSAMVTYPSAVFGLGIILFLIALSVYSVTSLPYSEAGNGARIRLRRFLSSPCGP